MKQVGREPGLCASAILSNDPHILPNAATDIRSLANPLVAGEFGLRFYAGVPLRTSDGHNLGTLCVIAKEPRPVDQNQIDDLRDLASVVMDQMELRLSARRAGDQAKIMAREIDHRVMNSLQFISSMLSMQSRSGGDGAPQLRIAADRVSAVARVHRHFYTEAAGDTVSCITYLRRLCADLSSILERPIVVEGDEGEVATTLVQPIGLLVNELVTNAAKHGVGEITVSYHTNGARRLAVSNLGEGFPPGFDIGSSNGLGMKVIRALVQQMSGTIAIRSDKNGARFAVEFPGA